MGIYAHDSSSKQSRQYLFKSIITHRVRPLPPQLDEERLRRLRLLRAEEVPLPGHPQVEGGGHDDPGRGGRGVGGGLAVGGGQGREQTADEKCGST